jgi:drug/metabolite transporter (DMT)-like permease
MLGIHLPATGTATRDLTTAVNLRSLCYLWDTGGNITYTSMAQHCRVWHHRDLLTLIRLSLMSNVFYFLLVAVAVQQVGIAATSLVIGLIPVMVPVLGRRDQHAPPFRQLLLPMTAIIAGVVLINLHAIQTSSHPEGKRQMLGILCAFAALLCWSRYAVENSRCLKKPPHQ